MMHYLILLNQGNFKKKIISLIMILRTIYDQLGKVGDVEYQELCKQKVEEIDPNIRYCDYNLKKTSKQ